MAALGGPAGPRRGQRPVVPGWAAAEGRGVGLASVPGGRGLSPGRIGALARRVGFGGPGGAVPAPVGPSRCRRGGPGGAAAALRGGRAVAAAVMWHRGGVDTADGPLQWLAAALCNAAARAGTMLPEHRAVTCPLRSSDPVGFGFLGGLPQGTVDITAVCRTQRQSRIALLVPQAQAPLFVTLVSAVPLLLSLWTVL